MRKRKKWLLGLLLIFLASGITLTVLWINQDKILFSGDENNQLRVAVPFGPASATFYVAMEEKLFSGESIRVKYQPFPSGRLALDALLGGGVDLAFVAETPLVFAALNSKEFKILAVVAKSPLKFVSRKTLINSGTSKYVPKYGVPMGTAAQYWMDRYLSVMEPNQKPTIVNIDAQNQVAALVSGSIDGFFCWEPFASMARAQFPNGELDVIDSRGIYTQFFVLVTLKDTIERDRERLEAFIASLIKASSRIADGSNHPNVIQIVAKYSNMIPDDLEGIWRDHDFSITAPLSLMETMNSEADWAIKKGIVSERKIDFADFLDNSLLYTVCSECLKTKDIK
jgi:ABC-type nitrate/sulfonate/bicarbonate transport system substrate-binding protein